MSDQQQFNLHRRSSYISTPVLSPTESIAFSDSFPPQHPYEERLDDFSSQDVYATHPQWRQQPTHYALQRAAHGSTNLDYTDSRPNFFPTSLSEATTDPLTSAYVASGPHAQDEASIQAWYSSAGASQANRHTPVVPVTHTPVAYAQALPNWYPTTSSRQLECFNDSRQNSLSGSLSNDSNSLDSLSHVPISHTHHQISQPKQHEQHHFPSSSMLNYSQPSSSFVPSTADSHSDIPSSSTADAHEDPGHRQRSTSKVSQVSQPARGDNDLEGQVPPKRKRGRPKLNREAQPSTSQSRQGRQNRRQPHNEIERKYREGLNSEMEKLREAIPPINTAIQTDAKRSPSSSAADSQSKQQQQQQQQGQLQQPSIQQKPTKAAVIKSAVLEIERLKKKTSNLQAALQSAERERDEARCEAEMLKRQKG